MSFVNIFEGQGSNEIESRKRSRENDQTKNSKKVPLAKRREAQFVGTPSLGGTSDFENMSVDEPSFSTENSFSSQMSAGSEMSAVGLDETFNSNDSSLKMIETKPSLLIDNLQANGILLSNLNSMKKIIDAGYCESQVIANNEYENRRDRRITISDSLKVYEFEVRNFLMKLMCINPFDAFERSDLLLHPEKDNSEFKRAYITDVLTKFKGNMELEYFASSANEKFLSLLEAFYSYNSEYIGNYARENDPCYNFMFTLCEVTANLGLSELNLDHFTSFYDKLDRDTSMQNHNLWVMKYILRALFGNTSNLNTMDIDQLLCSLQLSYAKMIDQLDRAFSVLTVFHKKKIDLDEANFQINEKMTTHPPVFVSNNKYIYDDFDLKNRGSLDNENLSEDVFNERRNDQTALESLNYFKYGALRFFSQNMHGRPTEVEAINGVLKTSIDYTAVTVATVATQVVLPVSSFIASKLSGAIPSVLTTGATLPFHDSQLLRGLVFCNEIKKLSVENRPDVLCFQELFNDQMYYIIKQGMESLNYRELMQREIKRENRLNQSREDCGTGLAVFVKVVTLDDGLGFFRDYKLIEKQYTYFDVKNGILPNMFGVDIFNGKGFLYGKIEATTHVLKQDGTLHKQVQKFNVVVTHPSPYVFATQTSYDQYGSGSLSKLAQYFQDQLSITLSEGKSRARAAVVFAHRSQLSQVRHFLENKWFESNGLNSTGFENNEHKMDVTLICGDMNINKYGIIPDSADEQDKDRAMTGYSSDYNNMVNILCCDVPPLIPDMVKSRLDPETGMPWSNGLYSWDGTNNEMTQNPLWPKSHSLIDFFLTYAPAKAPLYMDNRVVRTKSAKPFPWLNIEELDCSKQNKCLCVGCVEGEEGLCPGDKIVKSIPGNKKCKFVARNVGLRTRLCDAGSRFKRYVNNLLVNTTYDFRKDDAFSGECSLNPNYSNMKFGKVIEYFKEFANELVSETNSPKREENNNIIESIDRYIQLVIKSAKQKGITEETEVSFPEWNDISDHYGIESLVIIEPENNVTLYGKEEFDELIAKYNNVQLPIAQLMYRKSMSPLKHIQPLGNLYRNMNWFRDHETVRIMNWLQQKMMDEWKAVLERQYRENYFVFPMVCKTWKLVQARRISITNSVLNTFKITFDQMHDTSKYYMQPYTIMQYSQRCYQSHMNIEFPSQEINDLTDVEFVNLNSIPSWTKSFVKYRNVLGKFLSDEGYYLNMIGDTFNLLWLHNEQLETTYSESSNQWESRSVITNKWSTAFNIHKENIRPILLTIVNNVSVGIGGYSIYVLTAPFLGYLASFATVSFWPLGLALLLSFSILWKAGVLTTLKNFGTASMKLVKGSFYAFDKQRGRLAIAEAAFNADKQIVSRSKNGKKNSFRQSRRQSPTKNNQLMPGINMQQRRSLLHPGKPELGYNYTKLYNVNHEKTKEEKEENNWPKYEHNKKNLFL